MLAAGILRRVGRCLVADDKACPFWTAVRIGLGIEKEIETGDILVREVIHETEKALLVDTDFDQRIWIPKSQIKNLDEIKVGDRDVEVEVTVWFILKAKVRGYD